MSPTLNNGERWPITRIVDRVERGDIVVFYYPRDQSKSFAKRVIGLPGERITIRLGEVSVDGRRLDETYVATANRSAEDFEVAVQTDEFFLMGDNRRNSSDSRHWGAVPKALIWAKVVLP
jgi:signal peptidase I